MLHDMDTVFVNKSSATLTSMHISCNFFAFHKILNKLTHKKEILSGISKAYVVKISILASPVVSIKPGILFSAPCVSIHQLSVALKN